MTDPRVALVLVLDLLLAIHLSDLRVVLTLGLEPELPIRLSDLLMDVALVSSSSCLSCLHESVA